MFPMQEKEEIDTRTLENVTGFDLTNEQIDICFEGFFTKTKEYLAVRKGSFPIRIAFKDGKTVLWLRVEFVGNELTDLSSGTSYMLSQRGIIRLLELYDQVYLVRGAPTVHTEDSSLRSLSSRPHPD
jgi:hypothetical protein